MKRWQLPLALAAALWIGGCSTGRDEALVDYKAARAIPSLEVPPDLTMPAQDSRFGVSTTLSAYQAERAQGRGGGAGILPKIEKVRIERAGGMRWLLVDEPAEKLWPLVRTFWQDQGLPVTLEVPEAGIMETEWTENHAVLPQSITGLLFSRAMPQYDKYRTTFERTADGKGTEITITHRGLVEFYMDESHTNVNWRPRASDPALEAEFLVRLMARLGTSAEKARAAVAAAAVTTERATLKTGAQGAPMLELPEPFDRAWRRVGLALDRVGFTVEDRDRQKGLYFVRYVDPDAARSKKEESLFSRLAFWRSDDEDKGKPQHYRIEVRQQGEASEVGILDQAGAPAPAATTKRILAILHEQLK